MASFQRQSRALSSTNLLKYPKSCLPWSQALFQEPPAEYRGAPLWCWNNKLNVAQLMRQIDVLEEMGMGGFHMHCRIGLDTEYMGSEFMQIVDKCVTRAERKGMLACLYDEDRWPSGSAGGKVVAGNPDFRASAEAVRSEAGFLLAKYVIELDDNGYLKCFQHNPDGEVRDTIWYAYVEPNPSSEWFNSETYVDTLSRPAMARFIELTHEVYKAKLADKFGSVIPSIFTDEPQFSHKSQLTSSSATEDVFLPWSLDLVETFETQYGYSILKSLPEIIWDLPHDHPSLTRYHFHDHVCERFVDAFMDQIASWCRGNHIALTGHMSKEPMLWTQTGGLGEAMRCYRSLDLPGIDVLCDRVEFNNAKQASSVARQNGASGVMSELYGVTDWTFTFEGYKGQGDWQAALGVTFRVPHLTLVSLAGEAKRDFPASIGEQSPWYKEFKYIENHFARVNIALTRGRPITRVAVIHPIESYWLGFGPVEGSDRAQNYRESCFKDLTNWLLHGLVDFDFISESLLPSQHQTTGTRFLHVGQCQYEVVIVPNLKTIRSTTLQILQDFSTAGGKVLIAGVAPTLVDATIPASTPVILGSTPVIWSQYHILNALDEFTDVGVIDIEGAAATSFLYQLRQDIDDRFLFICNMDRQQQYDTQIRLQGLWVPTLLDTITGTENQMSFCQIKSCTIIDYVFEGCASLLLRLSPGSSTPATKERTLSLSQDFTTASEAKLVKVSLSEPNVFVFDYAEYKIDDNPWRACEEVLRIDNIVREQLDLPLKLEALRQPWSVSPDRRSPKASVVLRFTFQSEVDMAGDLILALEDADKLDVVINGNDIDTSKTIGWWIDEAIATIHLPGGIIKRGCNSMIVSYNFGLLTNIERIFLLGDFGVNVAGRKATLTALDLAKITFGNLTHQGLPFYGGNVAYHCSFSIPVLQNLNDTGMLTALEVPRFASPVLSVDLNNTRVGVIALEPHSIILGKLVPQEYSLMVTCYGSRNNALGHFHLPDGLTSWCGSNIWRTEHSWWTDEYNLKAFGILQAPRIKKVGKPLVKVSITREKDTL